MSGQDLLQGFSFVDERFVAEAETAVLGRKLPWMKVLSVAACLCILITGAYAMKLLQPKSAAEEAAPAAAAPESKQESVAEAAPLAPEEECVTEAAEEGPMPPFGVDRETPSGELQHIPYAVLRVVKVLDDGRFEAVAEAQQPMEVDTAVTVVVDPAKVPGADSQISNDLSVIVEGARFEIENGAYDAGENILYVAELLLPK